MYACLHQPSTCAAGRKEAQALLNLAYSFAPFVEQTASATVVFGIDALQRTIGPPDRIAAAIIQRQEQQSIRAHAAIASTPDTTILLARYSERKLVVMTEHDAAELAPLPLSALFEYDPSLPPELLPVLQNWGLSRCGDLAQLPENGLVERLGAAGVRLRRLASGQLHRPLRVTPIESPYEEQVQLEHALDCVEPLLFLVSRILIGFCERLRSQMYAARKLDIVLELERNQPYLRSLEFAVPLHDHRPMLKLLQLDLDRHPPYAPVKGFILRLEPVAPRRVQHHLLLPPVPAPDKLQLTLSRIAAMVGEANVGTPELLNTFRPDAFRLLPPEEDHVHRSNVVEDLCGARLQVALRMFRPPLAARVQLQRHVPDFVFSQIAAGPIARASGPWRSSGEWWATSRWAGEEWDVALEDGAVYRLFRELRTHQWFVRGVYD
jgi:protein ImuB